MRSDEEWLDAASASCVRSLLGPITEEISWYLLGDGVLGIRTCDEKFQTQFKNSYQDCGIKRPPEGCPTLVYTLRRMSESDSFLISFHGGDPVDLGDLTFALFSNRQFDWTDCRKGLWRMMVRHGEKRERFAFRRNHVLADDTADWRNFAKNLAVSHVMALQRNVVFFHAASVGIEGRAILLSGPKGSGKTTLSLALAARGHDFLGDEVSGVRTHERVVLPMRLSVAVRAGPSAEAVRRALKDNNAPIRQYPDGSERRTGHVTMLFPQTRARATPLNRIVFLRNFAARTRLVPVLPSREHVQLCAPLACSLWGDWRAARTMGILSLISRTRCYFLDAGPIDSAVQSLERLMQG